MINNFEEDLEDAKPYQWYRTNLLPRTRIAELSKLDPKRPIIDAIFCWLCIIGAWTACAIWTYPWVILFAIPIIGARYYALQIIGHDGIHRRLFNSVWLNNLFSDLVYFAPMFTVCKINGRNHLVHHKYLGTSKDPDEHKHCIYNKLTPLQLIEYFTGISSFFINIKHGFLNKRELVEEKKSLNDSSGYTIRDILLILICQSTLMFGLTYFIGLWAYIVLWLIPLYVTYLGHNFRSFAEHSQPLLDSESDNYRLITHVSNPLERFFVAPLNMNYHIAHHLWPSIPYYNLPLADKEIRKLENSNGLEWRGSYFRYVLNYIKNIPKIKHKIRHDALYCNEVTGVK